MEAHLCIALISLYMSKSIKKIQMRTTGQYSTVHQSATMRYILKIESRVYSLTTHNGRLSLQLQLTIHYNEMNS